MVMMKMVLFLIGLFSVQVSMAQVKADSELFLELEALDNLLFNDGFNQCKLEAFTDHISDDLEFYHDKSGITNGKEAFVISIEQNICGNKEMKPIRKLIAGSLEVHPLFNNGKLYGAVQSGIHEFYIKEPNKEAYKTSIAKFTHLWIKTESTWKLNRVLSYDHQ